MAVAEDDAVLEATVSPGRFDIIKTPASSSTLQPAVHFGDAYQHVTFFSNKIRAMLAGLDKSVTLNRLALGVILLRPVASRELAYHELGQLLKMDLDPAISRDFLYQINYPEHFTIGNESIELNRLSRWSSIRVQLLRFQLNNQASMSDSSLGVEENYLRCEIDNSSAADRSSPLRQGSLCQIFDRLIELADKTACGELNHAC